jgi:hypothetical protein
VEGVTLTATTADELALCVLRIVWGAFAAFGYAHAWAVWRTRNRTHDDGNPWWPGRRSWAVVAAIPFLWATAALALIVRSLP